MLSDWVQFLLYILQQAGVLAVVGAQTMILVAHLRELHTPKLFDLEERLADHARAVRLWGLIFIVVSGAAITAWHLSLGMWDVLLSPAFISKWVLTLLVLGLHFPSRPGATFRWALEGVAGAATYAMLIINLLAPVTQWGVMAELLALWALAFTALWAGTSMVMRGGSPHMPQFKLPLPKLSLPKPKPVVVEKVIEKPAVVQEVEPVVPVVVPIAAVSASLNKKETGPIAVGSFFPTPPPFAAPAETPSAISVESVTPVRKALPPHIRVMPKTEEEMHLHFA